MKYKLLTIVGATILLSGCGQTSVPLTREEMNVKEDLEQVSFEAKMLAENGEPTFEDLVKTASKDENGNIILTAQMRYEFPGCENTEAGFLSPNKNVLYQNSEWGISFNIPYNDKWKFCGYALNAYDEIGPNPYNLDMHGGIEFGPLRLAPESGSSLPRTYYLNFWSTSTPDKIISEHNYPLVEIKKIKINNLNVVRAYDPPPKGMGCSSLSYYIFGEKATYEFSGYCVDTKIGGEEYTADEFSKELEQIIKTIKLI